MYGVYASVEDLYAKLLKLPEGKRYAYEVIRECSPCRNYVDIEWVGDRDTTHIKMRALVANVRAYCKAKYRRAIKLYVGCSTRVIDEKAGVTAGLWKNSYHMTFGDLVFESNHGGGMAAFWTVIRNRLSGDEWHWDSHGKKTHIIDSAVYTRNRCMRLMLCSKRGGVPFQRISADPFDENDDLMSTYDETDPESWKPFVVSCPNTSHINTQAADGTDTSVIVLAATPQGSTDNSNASSKRRTRTDTTRDLFFGKRTSDANKTSDTKRARDTSDILHDQMSVSCIADLQDMLQQQGVHGCVVTGEVKEVSGHVALPLRSIGPRECFLRM